MRYSDFRLVEQRLIESNRGIIGTVIDTQSGRGISFTKPDGTVVRAVNAWKFPIEDTEKKYTGSSLNPTYIQQLNLDFKNKELNSDTQKEINQIINQNSTEDLKQIADAGIPLLSDQVATHLKSKGDDEKSKSIDGQFQEDLKNETGMNINTVKWAGGQKPSTGFAALVVELQVGEKTREWVGKYFASKKPDGHIFWQVTQFVEDLKKIGIELDIKRASNSTGTAGNVNFGPLAVGVTNRVIQLDRLVAEIRNSVQNTKINDEDQNTLIELIENLGGAQVNINPEYKANYEVQFGEIVAPLAITRGINVTGSIQDAEENLLALLDPGTKFTSINQVEFPENIAEKLIDSYLITPNGSKVGISSKDKKGGAAASISSIIDTINKKLDTIKKRVPDFEERYAEYISRLRVIENSRGFNVAYNLAVDMGIITAEVAKQALALMRSNPGDAEALKQIDNGSFYDLTIGYDGYKPKTEHPMYKISYHAVSSLARIVAAEFNKDIDQTYKFFATVLESSNMIQVKTTLTAKGDQAAFTKFDVIYPPVFDGTITLDPSSYFTATKAPVGFTFKIK